MVLLLGPWERRFVVSGVPLYTRLLVNIECTSLPVCHDPSSGLQAESPWSEYGTYETVQA